MIKFAAAYSSLFSLSLSLSISLCVCLLMLSKLSCALVFVHLFVLRPFLAQPSDIIRYAIFARFAYCQTRDKIIFPKNTFIQYYPYSLLSLTYQTPCLPPQSIVAPIGSIKWCKQFTIALRLCDTLCFVVER